MTGIVDNIKEKEITTTTTAATTSITSNESSTGDKSQVENQTSSIVAPVTVDNDPPMAVLPLNSSTKLDQEPNPFEQSFSGAASDEKVVTAKLKLPPVASITSPAVPNAVTNNNNSNVVPVIGGGILPKEVSDQFTWDTLRTGPLSPSMLQGPANPEEYYSSNAKNGQLAPPNNYSARSSFSSQQTTTAAQQATATATAAAAAAAAAADIQYMQQQPQQHQSIKMEHHHPQQDLFMHHQQQQQQRQPPQQRLRQKSQQRQRSISQPEDDHLSMNSNESNQQTKSRRNSSRRRSSNMMDDSDEEEGGTGKKKSRTSNNGKEPEDDEKRKNFLERNRIAALKCRQRKKQWLNNLQAKVEFLINDNERLQIQSESLKEEIVNLKTLLLAHKECPVAQSNGFHASAIQKAMPSMLTQQQQMLQNNRGGLPMGYGVNRNNSLQPQPTSSIQPSVAPASASTSAIPRFQRTNNSMMPVNAQESNQQQGMVAGGSGTGGSSSVLRF